MMIDHDLVLFKQNTSRELTRKVGIGVSPFEEYVPGSETGWWLTEELPRVLTPGELYKLMNDSDTLSKVVDSEAGVKVPESYD